MSAKNSWRRLGPVAGAMVTSHNRCPLGTGSHAAKASDSAGFLKGNRAGARSFLPMPPPESANQFAPGVPVHGLWQQAFARDMENAFRQDAGKVSVPHEYPPNPYDMPDGFGIVQWLANAAIRAKLPCGSIYTVNSVGEGKRGWRLSCDQGAHNYTITLVGKEWKLGAKR